MTFLNHARRVFTLFTLCAAFAIVASAQFESATVLGTVTDPSNAPISGASVTLTNVRTGVSVKSKRIPTEITSSSTSTWQLTWFTSK